MTERKNKADIAVVFGVQGCIVTGITSAVVSMHEVIFINLDDYEKKRGTRRLKAEIIRICGDKFDAQVFEDTNDIRVGQVIELSREFLSIELGPGLLGNVFDGLMNPLLKALAIDGPILKRGTHLETIDREKAFLFQPVVKIGDIVSRGQMLGIVREGALQHRIFVPFWLVGKFQIIALASEKNMVADDVVACISHHESNTTHDITLTERWPLRKPISTTAERISGRALLSTKIRAIDVMVPIVQGSAAWVVSRLPERAREFVCHVARHVEADVVIIAICGERASRVARMLDALKESDQNGRTLMSRSIVIVNSAAQPVAAREISLCAAVVVGEYYQQMGLNVLVVMDGVSRFTENAREIGGILDDKIDEHGDPLNLRSRLVQLCERASVIKNDDTQGALTIIGTALVDETLGDSIAHKTSKAVNSFVRLDDTPEQIVSSIALNRSWSKLTDVLAASFDERFFSGAYSQVQQLKKFVDQGRAIANKIATVGAEDVSLDAFVQAQKTQLFETVFLEQDFLNAIDRAPSDKRIASQLKQILAIIDYSFWFSDKREARATFVRLTSLLSDLNRMTTQHSCFEERLNEISDLVIASSLPPTNDNEQSSIRSLA